MLKWLQITKIKHKFNQIRSYNSYGSAWIKIIIITANIFDTW